MMHDLSRPTTSIQSELRRCLGAFLALGILFTCASSVVAEDPFRRVAALPTAQQVPLYEEAPAPSPANDAADDLLEMDIDQLGRVDVVVPSFDQEVTSVTNSVSTVGKSPAAVFIITQEMIRRSGKTSIPELLRLAPGIEVARIDANKWAITARGFNDRFADKLLVMIDGRVVYTQVFNGVYWDVQDVVLQDIERIEVIRGPGATIWGANAVNGVINIITKSAADTQGALVASGGGDQDETINVVRYGGKLGDDVYYRVYAKQFERDTGFNNTPLGPHDDWRMGRAGFRADWKPDLYDQDSVTFMGDIYYGRVGGTSPEVPIPVFPYTNAEIDDGQVGGGDLLARWTHQIDETSYYWLQGFYDRTRRDVILANQTVDTLDVEFQHRFTPHEYHLLTWGLGYRMVSDDLISNNDYWISVDPVSRTTNLYAAFVQDEVTLIEDYLTLYAGSKFQHNDFSGFEVQPTVRLLWSVDAHNAFWGAVSRAVRTPSRIDEDLYLRNLLEAPAFFSEANGNRSIEAEDLLAYELGYRTQETDNFAWDVALFYNDYQDLIRFNPIGPPAGFPPTLPVMFANVGKGESYGMEWTAQWDVNDTWKLSGWYSFMRLFVHGGLNEAAPEGSSPHNQAALMSSWDLPRNFEFDIISRYVDNLPAVNVSNYISLDARIGWRPSEEWEFSVVGQSLLEAHRREFESNVPSLQTTEVNRGIYAQATWRH